MIASDVHCSLERTVGGLGGRKQPSAYNEEYPARCELSYMRCKACLSFAFALRMHTDRGTC